MGVQRDSKKPKGDEQPAESPAAGKRKVLNVSDETHATIHKIAALRRLNKVDLLFDEPDVKEFFDHLLEDELDKERARLKVKK